MSPSKPRSFARWSRVSGMSSTMRTLIWSAIVLVLVVMRWWPARDRWIAGGQWLAADPDRAGPLGAHQEVRWEDAVLLDENLEDHAVGLLERRNDGACPRNRRPARVDRDV